MTNPKVYLVTIDEAMNEEQFQEMLELVEPERTKKIESFHFKADRVRSLAGYMLSKYMIMTSSGYGWKEIKFSNNEYGKPYAVDLENVCFNISHSGNKVAGAVSDQQLGIDVEIVQKAMMDIAKRCFDPKEVEYISEVNEEEQPRRFYEIWTRKESYVKAVGKGLSLSFSSFNTLDELCYQGNPYYIHNITGIEGYSMALCTMEQLENINVDKMSLVELYERIMHF